MDEPGTESAKGTLYDMFQPPPHWDLWSYPRFVMHFSPNLDPFLSLCGSLDTLASISSHGSYW